MEEPRLQRQPSSARYGSEVIPVVHAASWIIPAFITLVAASFVPEQFIPAADAFSGLVLTVFCPIGMALAFRNQRRTQ